MIKILFLEDSPDDLELMLQEFRDASMPVTHLRVSKRDDFITKVKDFMPDIILADYSLPSFTGLEAFRILRRTNKKIPFILVTGVLSERVALDCLNEGIDDFILKSSYRRLPAAIKNAIKKKTIEIENEKFEQQLRKTNSDLQKLTERLQLLREEERLNVARDLHDELGQMLSGIKIDVSMLRKNLVSGKSLSLETINEEFSNIIYLINQVTQSVKRIVSGLRPEILYELGIVEAIRWQCQEFEKRNKIACEININVEFLDCENSFAIALFRIVQETLTNIARHSEANKVKIQFSQVDGSIYLRIADNGIGIDEKAIIDSNSIGLIGIRERTRYLNGRFSISGKPGKGTQVLIIVPHKQLNVVKQD